MPSTKFKDKTYWLRGAEEVRRSARALTGGDEKHRMIEIAAVYERLADHYGDRPATAKRPPRTA